MGPYQKSRLREIFRKLGQLCSRKPGGTSDVTASFYMEDNPAYEGFEIGKWTYGLPTVKNWGEGSTLHIGKFCSIAEGVLIFLGGEHRVDWVTTYPFSVLWPEGKGFSGHPRSKGNVSIGNDVWIGHGAVILSGVTIGSGAVIGACSVVSSNVSPYEIVAGNPARHLRFRFSEATIQRLCHLAWWDWPESRIEAALPLLLTGDVEKFLRAFDTETTPPSTV
jgi:acetyltransferase-like isoleucine patch superfamily enzyme